MKINKIQLYNFNSYEGLNEFDFTCEDKGKNIVLIGGKNGAGKTSLFTAIKLALYGPLAFGYVGYNSHYIAKVKDCINSKAFQHNIVESRVQLTISLIKERENKKYEIIRSWEYRNQKLIETYRVYDGGRALNEEDLSYFQNYLQGIIPPDLFDFFLFDGEEVGKVFSSNSYNNYIKNAIYTLCGIDIYEIIRKFTAGYSGKAANDQEKELQDEYEFLKVQVESLQERRLLLERQIEASTVEFDKVETELIDLETAYKNAGGITSTEREQLLQEYNQAEQDKAECLVKIKMFVEGLMPFFIVNNFTGAISKQLATQEQQEVYKYIQKNLSLESIKDSLDSKMVADEETLNILIEGVLDSLKPDGYTEGIRPIHDVSQEEATHIRAVIAEVNNFDVSKMVALINKRKQASNRTTEINSILKNAMTDEEVSRYEERENYLLRKKNDFVSVIQQDQFKLSKIESELSTAILQRDKAFQKLKDNVQNKHVFELSNGICNIMETILRSHTISIRNSLEREVVDNLQHIYRKNNLITYIEIDEKFNFNLYQNAIYTKSELAFLMKNLGRDSFVSEVGSKGMEILYNEFNVSSLRQLQEALNEDSNADEITLYKRIDINRLSKGERQIFILSLYWAIIKISRRNIPFIIDTPYARIDANHRKEISEKFFPNISKQVVILSTDEEINEEYYQILKPYIAKEFLLINDENQNRTSVENHYFFGE